MSRIIVFGDVNQNYKDLKRLLEQSSSLSIDGYVCHGDIPNLPWRFDLGEMQKCVGLINQYNVRWIAGNHEQEILANAEKLGVPKSLANRIKNLPEELIIGKIVVKHSSPEGLWRIARRHSEFDCLQNNYPGQDTYIFGHSHRRCYHKKNGRKIESTPVRFNRKYPVSDGLHLINTGAIHLWPSFDLNRGYVLSDSDKQTITFKKIEK